MLTHHPHKKKALPGGKAISYVEIQNNQATSHLEKGFLICFVCFFMICTVAKVNRKPIAPKKILFLAVGLETAVKIKVLRRGYLHQKY